MSFSENALSAMRIWLSADTWYKNHPSDMGRFYDFVRALGEDRFMDEGLIRQRIRTELESLHPHREFDPETGDRVIERRIQAAADVYYYLRHVEAR